jgi:hypothetical protein
MSAKITEEAGGLVLHVYASGKMTRDDYKELLPRVEQDIMQHGKIRVLVDMHDFHGWEGRALWDDLKFDFKHFNDIERLAFVGENKWQSWLSKLCRLFTTAKIRYFTRDHAADAESWIVESSEMKKAVV